MTVALRGLHAALRPYADALVSYAASQGVPVTVTSVYRSLDHQQKLRANYELCVSRGLEGQSVSLTPGMSCAWPANRAGDSAHNYGLAWDSVVAPEHQEFWNALRRWAGWVVPPNDQIHAEYPNWRAIVSPGGS